MPSALQHTPLEEESAEPPPLRITLLIGHTPVDPIPAAVELAKATVLDLQRSQLRLEVRVDQASVANLRREALRGCDLLIYYGHGTADGHLAFADGLKAPGHLREGELDAFWQQLPACFLFACYGDRFAAQLPGPWLAFTEPILTTAPKGFLHAVVAALADHDLAAAVDAARAKCKAEMRSGFVDHLRLSETPLPALRCAAGEPDVSRLSPGLAGHVRLDFLNQSSSDYLYPEHDPFVGRIADLVRLFALSTPHDDELQRVWWVHGDPGMGKSALLRQFATYLLSLALEGSGKDDPAPAVRELLTMEGDLHQHLDEPAAAATVFYSMLMRSELAHDLQSRIWTLGEVVEIYDREKVRYPPEETEACVAVAMALVNKGVLLGALDYGAEALSVYEEVASRFGDRAEVSLVEQVAKALVNKGLLLEASDRSVEALSVYEEVVSRFGDRADAPIAEQVAVALVKKGLRFAALDRHDEALSVCEEVVSRFGDRAYAPIAEQVAIALVNKGFLLGTLERRDEALPVYGEVVSRFGDRAEAPIAEQVAIALVNEGVCLNALNRNDEALSKWEEVVSRFGARTDAPIAEQVAKALVNQGFILGALGRSDEVLSVCEEVVSRFGDRAEAPIAEKVARALFNKGALLGAWDCSEEAVSVYEEVVSRFGDRAEAPIAEHVAMALINKGVRLEALGRAEEALAAFMEVVERFGERTEPFFCDAVARGRRRAGMLASSAGC